MGISFERDRTDALQVEIPYSEGEGLLWLDSLGKRVDEVRLGFPQEYVGPVLDVVVEFATRRFSAGTIKVTGAAYGLVGSSSAFFRRLAMGVLTIMIDDGRRSEGELTFLLKKILVE